jgi:hypothetical protein
MGLPVPSTDGKGEEAGRLQHSEGQRGRTPGQEAAEPGTKGQEALEQLTSGAGRSRGQRSGEGLKHEWSRSSERDEAVREDAGRDERSGCRESAHQARRAPLPLAGAPLAPCSPRRLTELELTRQRAGPRAGASGRCRRAKSEVQPLTATQALVVHVAGARVGHRRRRRVRAAEAQDDAVHGADIVIPVDGDPSLRHLRHGERRARVGWAERRSSPSRAARTTESASLSCRADGGRARGAPTAGRRGGCCATTRPS